MATPSLTGSESFRLRIQRSESSRALLMGGVYLALIGLVVLRRVMAGAVMSQDRVFYPYLGLLVMGIGLEVSTVLALRGAIARGVPLERRRLMWLAVCEFLIPAALLVVLHLYSPRGAAAAFTAPVLLIFPITIMLSVMRLRPRTTLWLGLAAAIFHAGLAVPVIIREHTTPDDQPTLFSYALLLSLMGVAGALVTRAARRYVSEAVDESRAKELTALRLHAVERDLEVAKDIQEGLLPDAAPNFPGFDIAGLSRPAEQTGGDYYDWQTLPSGKLLVVMADVTGHGIGPALVMAVCRAYARASAPLDANLGSLLSRLNTLLHADVHGKRFITLAMAELDPSGRVALLSAGHGPSMFLRAGQREVEQYGGDGLPLAIMEGEQYGPPRQLVMAQGDLLVLLTDGVIEWQNAAREQFGVGRLAQVLRDNAGRPASEIVSMIGAAVEAHAQGVPQADDVTMVVIKRTAG